MYSTILNLHSYWAFATLLLLLAAIVNAILGMTGNKTFSKTSYKWSLYGFIAAHIQLLLGLILLFVSPHWDMLMNNTSTVMKDSDTRLLAVEHPIINILAVLLITMGWIKHKKRCTDKEKFKTITIYYGIGLLLLLTRIPWQNWL